MSSHGRCIRCSKDSDLDYGPDGALYCEECMFFSMNRQCVKCRMYIPVSEFQQYKGLWLCPICLQDMRQEDVSHDTKYVQKEAKPVYTPIIKIEKCEKCGSDIGSSLYIWNDKKLCKKCVTDEQAKWKMISGGSEKGLQKIVIKPTQKKIGLLKSIFSIFSKDKTTKEIIIIQPENIDKKQDEKKEESVPPQIHPTITEAPKTEGLMKKKRKKKIFAEDAPLGDSIKKSP